MKKPPYNLTEILGPSIEAMGLELWGIEFHPNSKNAILRIFIDKENGVSIDDCEFVSRQVSALLDVHDPIRTAYTLEVSSPGLDRLFFTVEQFKRYPNHLISFQLKEPIQNRRKFKGYIEAIEDDVITVTIANSQNEATDEALTFSAHVINQARLVTLF